MPADIFKKWLANKLKLQPIQIVLHIHEKVTLLITRDSLYFHNFRTTFPIGDTLSILQNSALIKSSILP